MDKSRHWPVHDLPSHPGNNTYINLTPTISFIITYLNLTWINVIYDPIQACYLVYYDTLKLDTDQRNLRPHSSVLPRLL